MSLTRRSTEGILDVVSVQTKHTGIPFLCYEEILSIKDHLSWNTRRSPSIFLCSNQPSQTRHALPKRTGEMRKTDSYSAVSSKSARSRHYYVAKSARSRHYHLASDRLITKGMNQHTFKIALLKTNVYDICL